MINKKECLIFIKLGHGIGVVVVVVFFLRAGGSSSLGMGTHSKMEINDNFISVPLNRSPSCLLGIEDEAQLHSDGLRCSTFLQ